MAGKAKRGDNKQKEHKNVSMGDMSPIDCLEYVLQTTSKDSKEAFFPIDHMREVLKKVQKKDSTVTNLSKKIGKIRGGCMWFWRKDLETLKSALG